MSFNLMNIGTSALLASQASLTSTGHNIANVNTPGYSLQKTELATRLGQYTGGGFVGRGVDVTTVSRTRDDFLATNATLTQAQSAADAARSTMLNQLEQSFPVGENGLGAAVNNVFSAFSDLGNTPMDTTARTTLLARLNDMTSRFNAAAEQLSGLQTQVNGKLDDNVAQINKLTSQIAAVNKQIQQVSGSGQVPNDLMDQRDQLVSNLNKYIQTSSVKSADGTMGIFVAGGQPLVLGTNASVLKLTTDPGDSTQKSLVLALSGQDITLDYPSLGGGEIAGLLRFQSQDLNDARNTVGRMALGIANVLNNEHKLGTDLKGALGGALFNLPTIKATAGPQNTSNALVQATVNDPTNTQLKASDYSVKYTAAVGWVVTRLSDGTTSANVGMPQTFDGLNFDVASPPADGDSFTLKPGSVAAQLTLAINDPQKLAATPLSFAAGVTNQGNLALSSLKVPPGSAAVQSQNNPYLTTPVTLTFHADATAPTGFSISVAGDGTGNPSGVIYVPGGTLSYNGWTLQLDSSTAPVDGDTLTIQSFQAAGNIRTDVLSGTTLTDAYATAIAAIGTQVQSGTAAASLSSAIATQAQQAASNVSGVNLDEEAAKLIQFQQSYQAAAKILTVAQTIFDTLLQTASR